MKRSLSYALVLMLGACAAPPGDIVRSSHWQAFATEVQARWEEKMKAEHLFPGPTIVTISLVPKDGTIAIRDMVGGAQDAQRLARKAVEEVAAETKFSPSAYEAFQRLKTVSCRFVYQ
jgi:hypothetical protein